jgi:hypothetical protein
MASSSSDKQVLFDSLVQKYGSSDGRLDPERIGEILSDAGVVDSTYTLQQLTNEIGK